MTRATIPHGPTRFPELNEISAELARRAAQALGDNFVGAYLVGSFALGDADEHSDVDFLVVIEGEMALEQEARLRALHAEFPERDVLWARHLEGSYPPRDELRTLDALGKTWLYVDNGAREMERSTHCNTALVRATLREHRIVLAGPDPRTLVDPVTEQDLRAEAVRMSAEYLEWLREDWTVLDNGWTQPYVVVTYCRILNTYATGRVRSKQAALRWAVENLDPEWRGLIQDAIDDRPEPWVRVDLAARPGTVEPTKRFVEHAVAVVGDGPAREPAC